MNLYNLVMLNLGLAALSMAWMPILSRKTRVSYSLPGLSRASSVLVVAVFAPTNPVLARGVQVSPSNIPDKNDVNFSLTAETGINVASVSPFNWVGRYSCFLRRNRCVGPKTRTDRKNPDGHRFAPAGRQHN